jgi:Galactose oxidase, central domain
MGTARASGSATLLSDGRVLLAGGYPGEGMAPTASAEVYDPVTDSFSPVAELATGRADHSATLTPDGRVLLAGGFDASGRALDTTEYFDPLAGRFTQGPELSSPRAAHVAVPVGREVVLVGGTEQSRAIAGTDVLRDGQWTRGPVLATPRVKLGAVPLGGSRILVVGGATDTEGHDRLDSSELVDLRTGVVRAGPRLSEGEYKLDGAVAQLPDGRVVVGGGSELEVYDPGTDTFEQVAVPLGDATSFRTVTPVGPDTVLVAGGYDEQIVPSDFAALVSLPVRAA